MKIGLPILVNGILLVIMLLGVIVGRKNGWKIELAKLICLLGSVVGIYFLTPVVANQVSRIAILSEIAKPVTFFGLFVVAYILITVILFIVKRCTRFEKRQTLNTAKRAKVVGINKQETKKMRKNRKDLSKSNRTLKQLKKASRVCGAVFGFIVAILFGLMLMLPTKAILNSVAEKTGNEEIRCGYEYTVYGQLDKMGDGIDKLIRE